MIQLTRWLQVRLQKMPEEDWRPSIIMITGRTFDRSAPQRFLRWLCHRYGVGTYLHYIPGMLEDSTYRESRRVLDRLIQQTDRADSAIYVDTLISPSMRSALAQALQLPGVSGMENNTILFEFSKHDPPEVIDEVVDGAGLAYHARMNNLVLRHGDHHFGDRAELHVWLSAQDHRNAALMIILAYILLGHPDWSRAELYPDSEVRDRHGELRELITTGRIPISGKNIQIIPTSPDIDFERWSR